MSVRRAARARRRPRPGRTDRRLEALSVVSELLARYPRRGSDGRGRSRGHACGCTASVRPCAPSMLRSMLMIGVMPLPLRAICDNAQGAAAHACARSGPTWTLFVFAATRRLPRRIVIPRAAGACRQPGDQQAAGAVVAKVRSDLVLAVPTGRDGTARPDRPAGACSAWRRSDAAGRYDATPSCGGATTAA